MNPTAPRYIRMPHRLNHDRRAHLGVAYHEEDDNEQPSPLSAFLLLGLISVGAFIGTILYLLS
jgi:hypothetical protein